MSNLQQLSDRVTHIELLLNEQHPDREKYLEALKVQHMSPEDAAAWRKERAAEIDEETIQNAAERAAAAMQPMIEKRANEIITLRVQEMVTAEIAKAKAAIEAAKLIPPARTGD